MTHDTDTETETETETDMMFPASDPQRPARTECEGPALRSRTGMTLVEVLAVVVILGLIATTLTLSFRGQMGRAKRELARTGIGVIVNAIESYAIETGGLPSMEDGLGVLTRGIPSRAEPFLKPDKLADPWGNPYLYIAPGPISAYQVLSYGADGRLGGDPDSEDADLTSDDLGARPSGSAAPGSGGS